MSNETPIININNLSKVYKVGDKEVEALKHLSLKIGHGEFVAIMGPQGSGKTTLVKILGCLDKPTGGDYQFEKTDMAKINLNELKKIRDEKIKVEDISLLKQDQKIRGNKVSLLIIDEPQAGSEIKESQETLDVLKDLSTLGVTVVLVTNEKDLAKGVKRIITMKKGEKVADVDLGIFVKKDTLEELL